MKITEIQITIEDYLFICPKCTKQFKDEMTVSRELREGQRSLTAQDFQDLIDDKESDQPDDLADDFFCYECRDENQESKEIITNIERISISIKKI